MTPDSIKSNEESANELTSLVSNPIMFAIFSILTLVIPTVVIILAVTSSIQVDSETNAGIIGFMAITLFYGFAGFIIFAIKKLENMGLKPENKRRRQRRKQIREAGLDQLEEGEEALSPEELEERINARLASRQSTERRIPVIEILNEPPSNETILQKMMFNGFLKGKTCAICKLDIRKRQKIVQCPYCQNLFHYDHLKDWFKNNKDCPVCDKILVK